MARERAQYQGLSMPWLGRWAERWVWRNADRVLPITEVLAQEMVEMGVDRKRIVIIPNGINPEHYTSLPDTASAKTSLGLQGRLVIGFTGFVREWDRLDRIVEWMATYTGSNKLHLLVVGDGPARQEIEAAATKHGLSEQVTFTGVVKRQDVPALANSFDIALQTALVPYASPLCLFEYLALGKAILGPDQPNHHEILTNRVDCLLYDPESATGLEQGLETLVNNEELRLRISAAASKVIQTRQLTWAQHGATISGLIQSLCTKTADGM
jgi:glycosyltransferase involved in cell wall biosynthesis